MSIYTVSNMHIPLSVLCDVVCTMCTKDMHIGVSSQDTIIKTECPIHMCEDVS